jgi:TonB family protein
MNKLAVCTCLALAFLCSGTVFAQSQTDMDRATEQALKALRARDIPEAELSRTTDEANWWKEVRDAGKAISEWRGGKKERDRFVRLIKEGLEKSYQVPIQDRRAMVLWKAAPEYTPEARDKQINGSVAMAIELRPDGTVGEVRIAASLDPGLDQMAANAARKLIFLPMVKDRKFVSSTMPMTMTFNIR